MSNVLANLAPSASSLSSKRHVLLMDEVDGMAGNEDRGGMQELIAMIKTTKIPIICMCNDRQSPKVVTPFLLCQITQSPSYSQIRMTLCNSV